VSPARSAVVIDAVRSPIGRGKPTGALAGLHAVETLSQVLQGLVTRTGIDPGLVDDVLIGCVSQAGEQAATPGRMAWLAAGYPSHVPAVTIDRRCGSGQQAIAFAAQGIIAGAYDIAIAGGVEIMSRVPMGSARMGADPFGPSASARYSPGFVPQGVSAELVADKWSLTRAELDEYSARSHHRAARADFTDEIVSIVTPHGTVDTDETIRPETTAASLAALKPVFRTDSMQSRYPNLDWRITAGSSSQISDGASAALIVSEDVASRLGLEPKARFRGFSVCGDDPVMMLTGPIPATTAVLKRSGVSLDDIGHFEVNEAFASVPLAWHREFSVDASILNPLGGAIALGHPLGASGGRLFATMLHGMQHSGVRFGLQTMCEAGGMANATLVERV
jgi:acetyl-CoA acyltransferase